MSLHGNEYAGVEFLRRSREARKIATLLVEGNQIANGLFALRSNRRRQVAFGVRLLIGADVSERVSVWIRQTGAAAVGVVILPAFGADDVDLRQIWTLGFAAH